MTALAAICLLVGLFAGYALGYDDGKMIGQLNEQHERLMKNVERVRDRNEQMLRLIRGGKA